MSKQTFASRPTEVLEVNVWKIYSIGLGAKNPQSLININSGLTC